MSTSKQIPNPHPTTAPSGGSPHWLMMLAVCLPVVLIAIALIVTGAAAGVGFVLVAVACVAMMVLMMRGMSHDHRP